MCYCDDTAFPVVSGGTGLVKKTTDVVSIAFTVFNIYGLSLSFENKKSQAIPLFAGHGSKGARRDLLNMSNCSSFTACGQRCSLSFVEVYKHVGSNFSAANHLKFEVSVKSGYIKSGTRAIARVLKCPHIELRRKINVIQSHLLSGGLYLCGTWSNIPTHSYTKLFHSILYAYRVATNNVFKPATLNNIFNDADLIHEFGLVAPMSMIRASRLQLFARLSWKRPPLLMEILHSMYDFNYGWVADLRHDLFWLSLSGNLPFNCNDLHAAEAFAATGKSFSTIVRKFAISKFANLDIPVSFPKFQEPICAPAQCPECLMDFSSAQRMLAHRSRKHDYISPLHTYVKDVFCPICPPIILFLSAQNQISHYYIS